MRMADAFRRFRRHPIYTTIGAVYAIVLIGMSSLVWLGALGQLATGQRFHPWGLVRGASIPRRMRWRHWSGRTSPMHLHNALAGLDLGQYPALVRYHVRLTLLLNVTILWACCAGALIMLAKSALTSIRLA